jgi:hypothetical protein
MKSVGKPCEGKPHARFDEGVEAKADHIEDSRHRQSELAGKPEILFMEHQTETLLYQPITTAATFCYVNFSSQ